MMKLEHVTFTGPPLDDEELLNRLPGNLAGLLRQINGFIQFHGGLHVRGACLAPAWHSLRDACEGAAAFHRLYPAVRPDDIPFAEDCMGDQFLLREGGLLKLAAETGDVEELGMALGGFFDAVATDPIEVLALQPLLQFQMDGGSVEPGQLLAAYPPFCTKEAANGVSLAAIATEERRHLLAVFAAQLREVPEGGEIIIRIED